MTDAMVSQLERLVFEIDGVTIAARVRRPASPSERPLVVAIHGGTYTGHYFDIPVRGLGLLERAAEQGFPALAFDRPGYGDSSALEPSENTFFRQADLFGKAIGEAVGRLGAPSVFLVGHSMGGMIVLALAAAPREFELVGASCTGVGSVLHPNGSAKALATVAEESGEDIIDLPHDERDAVLFGPDWTTTPELRAAARAAYTTAPTCELVEGAEWPVAHLPAVAAQVGVPVHHAIGEFDAIFDSSPEALAQFSAALSRAPWVESGIARGTGHSIDHHLLGAALHERQLAFAEECDLVARGPRG